jgi:hydroxyacylglutathione hydrolase
MAKLEIHQVPVLRDNYVYLLHEPETDLTAVVDPAVSDPVLHAAEEKGWRITHILNTHHHNDHTGGNLSIKEATGCTIVGARIDAHRIPGIDIEVGDGETYEFGNASVQVMEVPGHTQGHIVYWFQESDALFCGDTIFAIGCGRLSEGTADQLWASLSRLMKLPGETRIYCAHEYTQANGIFALSVEPHNEALIKRMREIDAKRAQSLSTVPSLMKDEWETNPFMRPYSAELQKSIGLEGADLLTVFAETRRLKDNFNAAGKNKL